MKNKYRWLIFIILSINVIYSCNLSRDHVQWYEGNEGLIEKAREEMNISPKEYADIHILGSVDVDNKMLAWFKTDESFDQRYCALEFRIDEKDPSRFRFVKNCNAKYIEQDVYICHWKLDEDNTIYSLAVNNETYGGKIQFEYADGRVQELEIVKDGFPLYASDLNPVSYEYVGIYGS